MSTSVNTKQNVTYTFERALYDAAGNIGAYAQVAKLSKDGSVQDDIATGDLTPDIFGNVLVSTVFDVSVPVRKASYSYRVKAVNGTKIEYRTESNPVEIDPIDYIGQATLSITRANADSKDTFKFTPSIQYKGALQANDQIVVYYVKGNSSSYYTGPYVETNKVTFNKTELEAGTPKSFPIAQNAGGEHLFVQAYFKGGDGKLVNIDRQGFWNYVGDTDEGLAYEDHYTNNSNDEIYFAVLNY